ncbi:hypothetical protein ACLSU7_01040 [Bdellovibrio sp. HCB185ZH]|uniref:hypothetical protein n=1 Tax=Bdellovibrio sp. HCB185ZH TaxID=3394235 RepID=UPI0039A55F30
MQPHACFERLIEHAKKTEMPRGFQLDIISALGYFKTQALCDLDRRDSPMQLRTAWLQLKNQTRGLKFFESFKEGDDNFWRIVRCFVYEVEPASLIIPKVEKVIPEKPPSRFATWQPLDFFTYLSNEIEKRAQITDAEKLFVQHGLWYIIAEAGRARGQRNEARIKKVWLTIQPLLDKIGLLTEFKKEESLIYSIKLFVGQLH